MEITRNLAEYVVGAEMEDFPPEAVYAAKGGILDCTGCMLAGSREPLADILCGLIQETGGEPRATVVGRGLLTSAPNAALVNGAMAHALDYDDLGWRVKGHPSVVLLPAALAAGEEVGARGPEVLLAYMVGFEVASSIGNAMSTGYCDDLGWHPTAPLGALGAGAAAAKLLKLDPSQTAMALSLAASQAAGLRQNFGTMTKPFHAGNSARSGVVAAMLVKRGFTASTDGIEGRFGFIHALSGGGGYDKDKVLAGLGKQFSLMEPGIEVKKYPCCGSAHQNLDALFRLLQREAIDPGQVEEVEVRVDFDPPRSLIHHRPRTALEGKFSMQYCIAAALVDQGIGLGTFTEEQILRPQIQALIPKIHMVRNPGHEGQPSWVEAYNEVRIRLGDGRVLVEGVHRPTEGALKGVSGEDLRTKFRDCASLVLSPEVAEHALADLEKLEELDSIAHLMDLLRGR